MKQCPMCGLNYSEHLPHEDAHNCQIALVAEQATEPLLKNSPFWGALGWLFSGFLVGIVSVFFVMWPLDLIPSVDNQPEALQPVYTGTVLGIVVFGIAILYGAPVCFVTRYMWRRNKKPVLLNGEFFFDAARFLAFLVISYGGIVILGGIIYALLDAMGIEASIAEVLIGAPLPIVGLYVLSVHLKGWEERLRS